MNRKEEKLDFRLGDTITTINLNTGQRAYEFCIADTLLEEEYCDEEFFSYDSRIILTEKSYPKILEEFYYTISHNDDYNYLIEVARLENIEFGFENFIY
jgi:hypothetical protein